ncbi:MAG TPA: hypothetical protein VE780_12060 [Thermoleophilaceae bacterium]|nr:hypothetical protein [Thermoleophilaceae bacterium]
MPTGSNDRPASYSNALCGVDVPGEHHGEVPATDHDDSYASCQVFAEAERGW